MPNPTAVAGPATSSTGRSTRDAILAAVALTALGACLAVGAESAIGKVLLAASAAFAAVALVLPFARRRAERAVAMATWASERDRNEAIATAARHSAHWQAIVDTATEGIVTINANGIIETCNGAAERMFGHTGTGGLVGRPVNILMPEPFASQHDSYLQRYAATGERRIIGIGREVVGRRSDGSEFPIDLSVGEGMVDGRRFFTAVIRDISERKEMQAKLGQTERLVAVGELAAGVAHEINNPINTMINCAQLVQDGDDRETNCKVIVEEGHRIADIVRDLLQFARDDRDRPQATSVPEVVQRTLRLIGENWKRHGISLVVDVPDSLATVLARPQQIQQVLLNLMINAKDAMVHADTQSRRVVLTAREADGGVTVSVEDNGPGVPEHLSQRIFEPFVTSKRARGGTGLGLSISKSILEGYGGWIDYTSQLGHGATFRFWLPVAPAE